MRERDQMVSLLRHLQDEIGFVDNMLVCEIAPSLNLARADVYGVITVYHDYR